MKWKPQGIVAIILALCILLFIVGGLVRTFRPATVYTELGLEVANIWGDIIKVLLGGLIAYIMLADKKQE